MDFNSFVYNNRLDHNVPIVLGIAKVEFRICASNEGEFGFDWFRVGDNGDNAFSKIVAQSQLNLLENEYERFTLLTPEHETYYVPYLCLFAPETVQKENQGVCEAKLSMRIKTFGEVEKIVFDYDKELLSVDVGNEEASVLTGKDINAIADYNLERFVRIRCIAKGDGFDDPQEIKVWAYPKEKPGAVSATHSNEHSEEGIKDEEGKFFTQDTKGDAKETNKIEKEKDIKEARKVLAGKILLPANSKRYRWKIKVVFIKVITNIEGESEVRYTSKGPSDAELSRLKKTFNHSLTLVEIEEKIKTLDLSENKDFKITKDKNGNDVFGRFIFHKGVDNVLNSEDYVDRRILEDRENFFKELRRLFFEQKGNEKYKNYYMAFYFAESTYDTYSLPDGKGHKTLAQTEGLNTKAVAVFNDAKDIDLTHEMLHSCGLRHPFSEKNWILFEKHMTDNIMDYVKPRKPKEPVEKTKVFTWKWQWRIVNPRLNVNVKGKKQATNKETTPQKNTSSAKKPTNKTTTAPNRNK